MTSFKFPPPPPPPPRAATSDVQPSYSSQRGGPSRGRGGDRGHGGGRGRGRGGQGRGNAQGGRGNFRGGHQSNRGGHAPPANTSTAYANPTFASQGGQAQPQMDPQAFAQAMSFMSTPAGVQSMAAFASHMSSTANGTQSPPPAQAQAAPRYSPGQQAGHKRKRPEHNASAPPLPQKKPQPGPKPARAKAAAPPPVPSFGFSLPTPSQHAPSSTASNRRDQKKRVNLGLGEQNATDDSSEEEDVDEEAAFADKAKVESVAFEHNGEMISLQTAADIQSYIKDRRRNFPTQQRIAEKAQEAAAKREHELEFLHRVQGKPRKTANADAPARPPKPERKPRRVDDKKQEELAALRKRLHESMTKKHQPAQPTNLLGLGYESETESDAESSVLSDSSIVSSSEDSSEESDGSSSSDDDAAPIPTSSKLAPLPVTIPPPAPSAPATQTCRNWLKAGRCKFGKACRWAHPPQERGSSNDKQKEGKRAGLFEKLVEQELEKADRTALGAIKYLGQNGFLG